MKNKKYGFLFLLTIITVSLLISGCKEGGSSVTADAKEYDGMVFITKASAVVPVPIPDEPLYTSSPEESQSDVSLSFDETVSPPVEKTDPPAVQKPAEPKWTETPASGIRYVNTDGIYSRQAAIMGSTKVAKYALNQTVELLAKTNTSYYKIKGGAYIHSDYLSEKKISLNTRPPETVPPETLPPETVPPETAPPETAPSETTESVTKPAENTSQTSLTPIMGDNIATAQQMVNYIKKMNSDVAQSVIDMIPYYLSEGKAEGVRGDIAFAQSCLETGYFKFEKTNSGSAVTIDQNNFSGLGVVALGLKGESFPTPQIGIRAQIQHLKAYASTLPLNGESVDNRFRYVTRGCAKYVEWLGSQENPDGKGWGGGKNYGQTVMNIYKNILVS